MYQGASKNLWGFSSVKKIVRKGLSVSHSLFDVCYHKIAIEYSLILQHK